jgi:hypothetical protein
MSPVVLNKDHYDLEGKGPNLEFLAVKKLKDLKTYSLLRRSSGSGKDVLDVRLPRAVSLWEIGDGFPIRSLLDEVDKIGQEVRIRHLRFWKRSSRTEFSFTITIWMSPLTCPMSVYHHQYRPDSAPCWIG